MVCAHMCVCVRARGVIETDNEYQIHTNPVIPGMYSHLNMNTHLYKTDTDESNYMFILTPFRSYTNNISKTSGYFQLNSILT